MIALDTNVIVRVVTRDDPVQARRAAAFMKKNNLWLSKTVLLEAEWVLRYTYKYDTTAIHHALSTLVGLENLTVEDATRLATFDRHLAKTAGRAKGAIPVELLTG